ncbi:MAG: hypothetical protein OHK0011_07880 [Turneriella sp.]
MPQTHVIQRARVAAELDFHDQLNAALVAHGEWKFRLAKGIETGCKGLEPEKIRVDNQCVFGQWLYSEKTEPHRKSSHYEKIRQLHAAFHKEAAGIVSLCHEGHTAEAKQALEGSYAEKSAALAEAIRTWLREFLLGEKEDTQQQIQDNSVQRVVNRYALNGSIIGVVSGFGFVLLSLLLTFIQNAWTFGFARLMEAHAKSWAQWVVDLAPLVLGITGYFLGRYVGQGKTEEHPLENAVMARTSELLASQREMQMMRDALQEGVFYLDRNKKLGSEFSAALKEIFEQTELAGISLLDLFRGRVDETSIKELDGYLDLLFDKSHGEAMLAPLNPFNPLILPAAAGLEEKILKVVFRRILNTQGEIVGILGIANDVTKEVKAEREAASQREAANRQLELIGRILETGPQMLSLFRQQVDTALNRVSDLLQRADKDLKKTLDEIYRHIHTIKGSASLLKIDNIASAAHAYEEELSRLKNKSDLSNADFIALTIKHGVLSTETQQFEALIDRIRQFQAGEKAGADERALLVELSRRAAEAAAEETGKEITFTASGFDQVKLPPHCFEPLRAILIQLVRNSAAHGIEPPAERERAGKPRIGEIQLTLERQENQYRLVYSDNGAGIDPEKIRARAVERRMLSPEEAKKLTTEQTYKLLFQPGFSTAEATSMTAGRGVGMDIVLAEVKKLHGRLALRSQVGKGTEFIITLPAGAGFR